jgi:cobalt-zinc-cadmium resistance protein CzcA
MLNGIIDWSLHNRFLVLAAACVCVFLGLWSVASLNIDAFPDTTPVQVQINTTATGLAAQEVERQITFPIEQALSGLPSLQAVRSLSKVGLSQVTVVFQDGTSIYFARQQVSERLNSVELPEGTARPKLGPIATGLGEVFHYLVTSKKAQEHSHHEEHNHSDDPTDHIDPTLMDVRTAQDWILKPGLRTVPGTAEINSWGGQEKQYQVRIDLARLIKYNLSFEQVVEAVRANNLTVGGGYMARAGAMYQVRGLARTVNIEQIKDIVISTPREGVPIRVGDVAEVAIGHDLCLGGVTANGKGEVVLGLGFMLMGENSHEVTQKLKDKFNDVKRNLPKDMEATVVYDRTELVDHVIDTVRRNLFEGGLLVVAVLFIFLGNLRAGLIVALAIPLSMLFAFSGMLRFGISGSLLSLGAIDFGLVVDSSVVMVENVVRHLAHDRDKNRSRLDVVRSAAIEVRGPTMFGELIIMIVYLPILTLQGVEGKMFRPMALTVIFALLGSMVLSLTLMPVLASLLLPRHVDERDPWLVRLARWLYAPVLRLSLRFGTAVLTLGALALAVGVLVAVNLGGEFIPRLSEGALVVGILRLPGIEMHEAMRYNTRMEKLLLEKFPTEVANVWARVGTAEVATDPMGPEEVDFFITLKPRDQWRPEWQNSPQSVLVAAIRKEFEDLPGQRLSYTQPIEQRVKEMISGVRADVAVKVFGDDFEVLIDKSEDIERVLRSIPGAADVSTEPVTGTPEVQVRLRQDQLARYGVSARTVLDRVEALGGKVVGDVVEGQLRFPLAVRLPRGLRAHPESFGALLVTTGVGEQVPLSRLAEVEITEGPAKIQREWGQRRMVTQCNVVGRDVAGFVDEAKKAIARDVKLPSGRYHIEWGGDFQNLENALERLFGWWYTGRLDSPSYCGVVTVSLMLILVLLYITYKQVMDVLLVFTAVPFACVGGVLALWWRELPFSISAGVGFIALSGVSVLNSLVLVTFIRQLREAGMRFDAAIVAAALTRLRPVLMTALVASLGFLPMALSTGVGAEVQRPLATVVIGGVISSTVMTLLMLPVLYHYFGPRGTEHMPLAAT